MARNSLNTVRVRKPRTNYFDLSHDFKFSCKMGQLVPVLCAEMIPGDNFQIRNEIMLRFAPLIAPVMHRVDVSVHYWFVPYRIMWPQWEDFITGGENGDLAPAWPYVKLDAETSAVGTLADYLGFPVIEGDNERDVSAFPFAAYQAIWSEWYRDQNLIEEPVWKLVSGDNSTRWSDTLHQIRKRAWQHDYFTAALPFAQKGADVLLPLGTFQDVPVYTDGMQLGATNPPRQSIYQTIDSAPIGSNSGADELRTDRNPGGQGDKFGGVTDDVNNPVAFNAAASGLLALTSQLEAEAATINNLRLAFRLQEWEELNARGGGRYAEVLLAHFGVRPQDYRLQRPEYVGGSKQPVTISEVLNTVGTEERPQGDMAGHGLSIGASRKSNYYAREHGVLIGVMSVMPKPAYQQGIPRAWLKSDKYMYYWPTFAHLGEQEVMMQELYANADDPQDTFGYLPRYQEYRQLMPRVAGDFKTSLNFWHFGRIFSEPPALNQEFIEVDWETLQRPFAVQDGTDNLWCHIFHKIKARRPIPKFGTPSF